MDILVELLQIIVRFIMTLLIFRFWMQWAGVNFYNPIAEMIVRFSEPFTKALRPILPRSRRYDWGSLVALLLIALAMILVYFALLDNSFIRIGTILPRAIFMVISVILNTMLFTVFISVIASWFAISGYNPAFDLLRQLTDPLLLPFRRLLPPSGGMDFSPMLLILMIWLTLRVMQKYFLF